MKKTSPDSTSYTDRIRSWARTKAHGPSPFSSSKSRTPTLPLSTQDTTNTQLDRSSSASHNDSDPIPPFPSTDAHGARRQNSKPTTNIVADNTSADNPPPAPPPEADGEGTLINTEKPKKNVAMRFWLTAKSIILSSIINLLLVFVPVGIAAKAANLSPGIVFGMNAIAIIPLAGLLSHATESVAKRMGDTIGALMNVTFGNAVELIIFIIALQKNEIRIVQASLLGSILANLLLILGMCFLVGGLRFREQIYNSTVTQMSACLLSLSVMSLLLPTAFHASYSDSKSDNATRDVLKVSRGTSVILLLVYGMYLLFQLKSHAYMYESTPQHIIDEELAPGPVAAWMDSSDSDSSSSSSDSDASSGSNTTAKRIRRVMRGGRRRRKSSSGSKETAEIEGPIRTPSFGTSSISPVHTDALTEEPQFFSRQDAIDIAAEDGDDDERHDIRRSRRSSILGQSHTKKEKKKDRKRREKRERKHAKRNGNDTINEGVVANSSNEKAPEDIDAPRRVDFAVAEDLGATTDSSQKRPFTLRGISGIPKTFSQSVFSTPISPVPTPPPVAGPIPRVKYGIRRTNSLPDRLNQTVSNPTRSVGNLQPVRIRSAAAAENAPPPSGDDEDENISRTTAVFLLLISTALVAVCAEFMVDSINAVVDSSPLSEAFVGLIILPIVGNAAEHVTAVTVASKNKMDLAIGVAVGSSIQIALFVTPFIVLLGWAMNREMSLYFTLFETVSLFVSAFIVNFLVLDGRSNYLEGALLCAAYVIIAVAAFFYPKVEDQSVLGGNPDATDKMIRDLSGLIGF